MDVSIIRDAFLELHPEDKGKFKVGQSVKYIGEVFPLCSGETFTVLASNVQDEESTEYLLEGFPYLVWEEELEEVS